MNRYRKFLAELTFERGVFLTATAFVAVALVVALFVTLGSVNGARNEIKDAHYSIQAAEREVSDSEQSLAKFVGVLEGMGHELKGLSTNIEQSEAECHKIARESAGTTNHPANAFQHYQFCMSHHGWRPVGWKG